MVIVASVGDYPDIGDTPRHQRLRTALKKLDEKRALYKKGDLSFDEFEKEKRNIDNLRDGCREELILEQSLIGLDQVTDGFWSCYERIDEIASHLNGVDQEALGFETFEPPKQGLDLWFNTNNYYRKPVIHRRLSLKENFLFKEANRINELVDKKARIVIPGPLTLAHSSKDNYYKDFEKLADAYAQVLKDEISTLPKDTIVQLDEPWLAKKPEEFEILKRPLRDLINNENINFSLNAYSYHDSWKSIEELIPRLIEFNIDTLHLDLVHHQFSEHVLNWPRTLCLGLASGYNNKIENKYEILKRLRPYLKRTELILAPNHGLSFLFRDAAQKKLELLVKAKKLWNSPYSQ